MKKDILVALIALLIFTIIDIVSSSISQFHIYKFSLIYFYFLILYLLTCKLKWKLRKSFRLPLIQLLFSFGLYSCALIFKLEILVMSFYVFYELIQLFYSPIEFLLPNDLSSIYEILLTLILIFIYKIAVLELSNWLTNIILNKSKASKPSVQM